MNTKVRRALRKRQQRIAARHARRRGAGDEGRPVHPESNATYEVADRVQAIAHGGIGAVQKLVNRVGLAKAIDQKVEVLKAHRPYHESDHVLNIAFNAFCGGRTLEDIKLRRNDANYLNALGVETIPDATTEGDFCRRFESDDVHSLMDAINTVRCRVWKAQGSAFLGETAKLDADGSLVSTTGECKEGMALSYKNTWGYHPLVVSMANTAEPLFIVNRSGNRGSAEGAAEYLDKAIALCREAGFTDILLRGDTDFSQTKHLDRWSEDGVRFVFGYDARANLKRMAEELDESDYAELNRRAKRAFVAPDKRRARPPRVKEQFVRERGYKNIRLDSEDIAEFDYRPQACREPYRMVVLRKNLTVARGETALFDDIRYFFYITNDRGMSAAEVVYEANDRCDQENLIAQLKDGVHALHAPVNTLNANWAYMVMASLAWTLKAWMALSLPVSPRWRAKHLADRQRWLRMEFRTFLSTVINVPAQVLRTGRRRILRLLAWKPELHTLLRLHEAL